MSKPGIDRRTKELAENSRLEDLLGLLGELPSSDPPPELRDRLNRLGRERLGSDDSQILVNLRPGRLNWFRVALVTAGLVLIAAVSIAVFWPKKQDRRPVAIQPDIRRHQEVSSGQAVMTPRAKRARVRLPKVSTAPPGKSSVGDSPRLTIHLPYSNSAVETGTATTIRVAMTQSELLSLGFPVNATLQDHRVVAELMLGGDGLPRAISLPLPLEVIKEMK